MRISKTWLNDFVDCEDLSPTHFYELITTKVAEVDHIVEIAVPLEQAIVCAVKSVRPHPERKNLVLANVSLGSDEKTVVCGAPNCQAGMTAVYLPLGARFRVGGQGDYVEVAAREVSGVKSQGVLLSEAELDLSSDHSGLFVPEKSAKVGSKLSKIVGGPDTVLEIDNKSLTHRPDLWSHFGFARELSAILGRPLKNDIDRFSDASPSGAELLKKLGSGKSKYKVEIEPSSKCRRFIGLEFSGLRVEASPLWLRRRLFAVGAGVRNFLVDLSNYVMHDIGQPNHAYDADLLRGELISVRHAKAGEAFLGLDGLSRELSAEDIVIADEKGAVALAGISGGQETAICDSTKRLFLESANFDPVLVRYSTKRHALRTDASNRFEKSRSAYSVPLAIQRYAEILLAEKNSVQVIGAVVDNFPERPKAVTVPATYEYIRSRLDPEVSDQKIKNILVSLGFSVKETKGKLEIAVPYERATRDISIAEDLVEEVGRIYGYEAIQEVPPLIQSVAQRESKLAKFENCIRDRLAGCGFSEVYNYSFMSGKDAERLGFEISSAVKILNPIDAELELVRTTLVPGMIEVLDKNSKIAPAVFVFEVGRAYETKDYPERAKVAARSEVKNAPAIERRLLSLGYMSATHTSGLDFYALRGVVERIVRLLTRKACSFQALTQTGHEISRAGDYKVFKPWMHPYRGASISVDSRQVAVLAEVAPGLIKKAGTRAVVAELDLEMILSLYEGVELYQTFARFPVSFFEMSVVMPKRTPFSVLSELINSNVPRSLLKDIEVLSVYEGAPLQAGEKSISVKLSLGADDRTLSSEEVSSIQNKLINSVETSAFHLRS